MSGALRSVLAGLLAIATTAAFGGDLGTEQEILAVIAYLQSLGGTSTVTLETTLADLGGE